MTDIDLEKLAPRRARVAARLIDLALISMTCWLLALTELFSGPATSLAWLLMTICSDAAIPGRSPGKHVFKIAVVAERDYQPCSRLQAVGRNIPMLFLPLLDWSFAFCRDRRRIGDNLCNTLVVKQEYVQAKSAAVKTGSAQDQAQMSLETIAVFGTMLEAEILSARLNADGIPAIVVDGNLVQAYSLIAIAVGGVRVQVMGEYAARARELVKVLNDGGLMLEG
ncbi:RDD family protein [Undibacterium sp.]|jgi:uncharacterized RDD family membrane protein YckC|uniref:RDD family protein n=1 Tax=Undibacterium sp. TaxID=1914977 RepID=UPI002B7AF471|nr:RDD family protein [Undibacterium sp.]HTD06392.1 RDD family protein [Undibacterium sp.]